MEGQIRVVSDSLGTRVNLQVPSDHTIPAWLVEFGEQSVGTLSDVLKTWTVQRKAHGQETTAFENIVRIGMEILEVEIPRVPTRTSD